jgi:hypothetical protein
VKEKRILFVEGPDDQHTIWALCEHFQVAETFAVEVPDGKGKINLKARASEKGGDKNVLKAADLNLIEGSSAIERLGIVLDADPDKNQWERVIAILKRAGYEHLPKQPDAQGTILTQDFLPTFGLWLMPDNQVRGVLEDFLALLVPDAETNEVWAKAVKCSEEVLDEVTAEKRFAGKDVSKARMYAYLAWQKECGKPFGQAITAKYLQAGKPESAAFANWLQRLFVD